jgi:2-phospho-L-lactate guanylyltransferase
MEGVSGLPRDIVSRDIIARDIVAVVPVKDFALAKQRLAGTFPPAFRARLARTMLRDVLEALRASEGLAGIVVVTADPEAGLLARDVGARLIFEQDPCGLNPAVADAAARLAIERRGGVLVLPSDIPAVTPEEIGRLLAAHGRGRAVSLVRAHDGQGTNALLASPPDMLDFAYGPASFSTHFAMATARGIVPRAHDAAAFPHLALDVDTPEDVAKLGILGAASHTRRLLEGAGLLAEIPRG